MMKKIFEGECDPPWCIVVEVKRTKEMRDHFNVIFQHVFREINTVADVLANLIFYFCRYTLF